MKKRTLQAVVNNSRGHLTNAWPSGLARVLLILICSGLYSSCVERLYTYEVRGNKITPSQISQACQIVDEVARSEAMQRVQDLRPETLRRYQKHSMTLVSGEVNTYVGLDIKSDGTVLVFAAGTDNFHADSLNLRLERTLAERFSAVFGGSHVVRVVHEIPQPVGF